MFSSTRSSLLLASIHLAIVSIGFVGAIPHDTTSAAAPGQTITNDPSGCCSPCVAACGEVAEAATGCNHEDPACLCKNTFFQSLTYSCVQANCTAEEVNSAIEFQYENCGFAGVVATTIPVPTTFTVKPKATAA
ncbi:hypothetical protein SCHPADRAFT_890688 [Schizopora paradoxa]|uniref:CFEM domain-containing protein n=1 Tax=Schizopora paradoxa TaxID=27342 RepID=A0A0H2RKM7_9AGAM|nr:hypothetical protein SCHPADRAFT_890688 [Schizopora paradoxa]